MTYAPRSLQDWRTYMQQKTGLPAASLGHVGSDGHHQAGTSYHIGWSHLRTSAYSRRHQRDIRLKNEAASATDTGYGTSQFTRSDLIDLTMWAVAEARAGRRPDTREIIGPWDDGRAYRFDVLNGWKAERRSDGDSHETHMHESRFRDAENNNWVQYYRPFFEGSGSSTGGSEMIGLKRGDQGQRVYGLQGLVKQCGQDPGPIDGIYGKATARGLLAVRRSVGSKAKSGAAVTGRAYAQLHVALERHQQRKTLEKTKEMFETMLEAALGGLPGATLPVAIRFDLPELVVPVELIDDEDDLPADGDG